MKAQILAIYMEFPPLVRAGIADLIQRIIWAAEHDPETIPLIMDRPSELATLEQNADAMRNARDRIAALLKP